MLLKQFIYEIKKHYSIVKCVRSCRLSPSSGDQTTSVKEFKLLSHTHWLLDLFTEHIPHHIHLTYSFSTFLNAADCMAQHILDSIKHTRYKHLRLEKSYLSLATHVKKCCVLSAGRLCATLERKLVIWYLKSHQRRK